MRHAKKPIALLLVLLMFVSLLPVGALAADAEPAEDTEAVENLLPDEAAEAPAEEAADPADPAAPADGVDPAPAEDGGEVMPPAGDPADAPADDPDPDPADAPDADAPDADDEAELETQAADPIEDEATGLIYTVAGDKATIVGYNPDKLPATLTVQKLGNKWVEVIADGAFKDCATLERITLPDNHLKAIGANAFENCTALDSMDLPKGVNIGARAFKGCTSLAALTFDKNVGTVGSYAFVKCTSLVSVELPQMESISAGLFSECSSLAQVKLPKNLLVIDEGAFFDCTSLHGIELPDTLTTIGRYAFSSCSGLESIDIPDSVTKLGDEAFYECVRLKEVRLSKNLKEISLGAFCDTAIQSIEIPEGVTSIGWYAFEDCRQLQSVTLPESLKTIDRDVFSGCTLLTEIAIPDSVTSIGEYAFYECLSLESLTLPAGLTTIEEALFYKCSALESIMIPDGVTEIGEEAFYNCAALTGVRLPSSLRTIGEAAFSGCTALKSIAIPNSVTAIGAGAFIGCEALTDVRLPEGLGRIASAVFAHCSALESIVIPDGVTAIEKGAFYNATSLWSITIPASVTSIGENAFNGCPDLTVYYAGTQEQKEELKTNTGGGNDALFASAWTLLAETEDAPAVALDREYIATGKGEHIILTVTAPETVPEGAKLIWSSDNEAVAQVVYTDTDEHGRPVAAVTVGSKAGTATVTATLSTTAGSSSARCRIDVTEDIVLPEVEDVTLVESKATVEVFRTDYARITVVPNLTQNAFGTTSSLIDGIPAPETDVDNGVSVRKAEFADPTGTGINDYFTLRVVDDRTLEIVPTRKALEAAEAKDAALKATYKNAVNVWLVGSSEEEPFTTGLLTLTVKKSLPKLKAAPVKLNSFIKDKKDLSVTGGTVTKITAIEGTVPDWLIMPPLNTDPADLTVKYDGAVFTDAPKSQKASLKLTVEAEGWAIRQVVPVTVTAAPILPKVKFSKSTVTINPMADQYNAMTMLSMTVTPALYADTDLLTVRVLEGKEERTVTNNYSEYFTHDFVWRAGAQDDGTGRLFFGVLRGGTFGSAEKARTFKVMVGVGGKEFPLTLKTPAAAKAGLGVSVKAAGAIDLSVPNSPVTLNITMKNTGFIDPALYQEPGDFNGYYTVTVMRTKDGVTDDVVFLDSFYESEYFQGVSSSLTRVTLTQELLESEGPSLDTDYTYTADVTVSYGDDASQNRRITGVKIPVKESDPSKVQPSVTAKVKGKLDVLRPGSEILLTPTFRNVYNVDLSNPDHVTLMFLRKDGKDTYDEVPEGLFTAEVNETGTAYRIRMNPGFGVNYKKDKFVVGIFVKDPADSGRWAPIKKPVNLPLTMGSAKVTQSTKTVTLLKRDKNSSATFTLGTTDPALKITAVQITNDKLGLYKLTELGSGQYAVSCTRRMLLAPTKGTTLKLAVTLAGNNSGKPNATISLAVKFA